MHGKKYDFSCVWLSCPEAGKGDTRLIKIVFITTIEFCVKGSIPSWSSANPCIQPPPFGMWLVPCSCSLMAKKLKMPKAHWVRRASIIITFLSESVPFKNWTLQAGHSPSLDHRHFSSKTLISELVYDEILGKRVLMYWEIGFYCLNCCNGTPKVAIGCYIFSERRYFSSFQKYNSCLWLLKQSFSLF